MFSSLKPQCLQFKNGDQFWSPFFFIFFTIIFIVTMNTANADNQSSIKAWFKLAPKSDSLIVLPMVKGQNETMIRYEISATKIGPSGRSQNSQGGQLLLPAQQEMILSTLQFGLAANDLYQFKMRIFINNTAVATVTAEYP